MKFRDVAHLYKGCIVQYDGPWTNDKVIMVMDADDISAMEIYKAKPILYPLSAMTFEQAKYFFELPASSELMEIVIYHNELCFNYKWYHEGDNPNWWSCSGAVLNMKTDRLKLSPNNFHYLLSNHFDLFNLIEQGEAIDVTTLENNPYNQNT